MSLYELNAIREFVILHKPVVYILTPCYGNICSCHYTLQLLQTDNLFRLLNIPLYIEFCANDSLITRARNNLVAKAMSDNKMTHILFIDNDIIWNPHDVLKLLLSKKDLIGGVYPLKKYHWDRLQIDNYRELLEKKEKCELLHDVSDENILKFNAVNYNCNYLQSTLNIVNNILEVKHLPTGFMMISRTCITKLQKEYPTSKYTDDVGYLQGDENDNAYALFDTGVVNGHYYSEDWNFCEKWTALSETVYAEVSINLSHIGTEVYDGSFAASILMNAV
jgi:hypothetical protein